MTSAGKLYLIPAPLGETPVETVIPSGTLDILRAIRHFVVEEVRTARRYLVKAGMEVAADTLSFSVLNEHTPPTQDISTYLQPALNGLPVGLLSEAGVPAVADPGARLILTAHRLNIEVMPLVGPSSILLALMASGLNGQQFAFAGYLPVKPQERQQRLRILEKHSANQRQTQIFIETPYRNEALFNDLLATCKPDTLLCVAANLTQTDAFIKTTSIAGWNKLPQPGLNKKPCVFLLLSA